MTRKEEEAVATHEAGHAVVAMFCEHAPPIDRISILSDFAGALGFVKYQDPAHRYVVTRGELLDRMTILMGGREAEQLLLDDLSIGSVGDVEHATEIARSIVEEFGMGGDGLGAVRYHADGQHPGERRRHLSSELLEHLDRRVRELVEESRHRAAEILAQNRTILETLRTLLLDKKVIEATALSELLKKP
jgi:cell division protease FtsH